MKTQPLGAPIAEQGCRCESQCCAELIQDIQNRSRTTAPSCPTTDNEQPSQLGRVFCLECLARGVGKHPSQGPTLLSIRRIRNLTAALREINRKPLGYDGLPYMAYADPISYARVDPRVLWAFPDLKPAKYLQEEIELGEQYEPPPTEPLLVKGRLVERATVGARIIERAATRKLNANLDRHLSDRSYGYRPGRSPETAILRVRDAVRRGRHWAFKADIAHFFPSIDRGILEQQLRASLADECLCKFLMNSVAPIILDVKNRRRWERINGLPQGSGLSPFLSNVYLHRVDEACAQFEYFRFADDVLILGSSREEVAEAGQFFKELLARLKLQLKPEKTFIRDLYQKPLTFLGFQIQGGNLRPPLKAIFKLESKLSLGGTTPRYDDKS